MQISQLNTPVGSNTGLPSTTTDGVDAPVATADSSTAKEAPAAAEAAPASAPLRRGLSSWDHHLQGEIASAQQALDFLDQSASQLQALKSELAARLASQPGRDGQVEARVRQFSQTWKTRQSSAGGTLDAQLAYTSVEPAKQRFSIRGLNLANLQSGAREVLAFSVGGANQALRSVTIDPDLPAGEIVQRFDQALAPANIRVSANEEGTLIFSTPEADYASVRDSLAVRGSGIRFPTGQLNRVKTDEEVPAITPEGWGTGDAKALRQTLHEVVQALAQVQLARENVSRALTAAAARVESTPVDIPVAGIDRLAQNFVSQTKEPGYDSLRSIGSALVGISRERVLSLLGLR